MKTATWVKTMAMALLTTDLVTAPARAQTHAEQAPAPAALAAAVKSKDGTTIAHERCGKGPVLVLVASALADRSGAGRLASLLAPSFTVINFDRRGRGKSGDTKPYAVAREIEDIEALIDKAGGKAALFGSSSGAALALEAADKLGSKVSAVALFEPPFIVDDTRPPISQDFFEKVGSLVAADRRSDAVALFMSKGIGVPDDMVAQMKQAPMWPAMEKLAHTIPYDGAILKNLQSGKPLPARRWKSIAARVLVIDGEQSPPFLRNAATAVAGVLPGARRETLPGQDHSVVLTAPEALVPVLTGFLPPLIGAEKQP
jgi:pimeloyl-ACP methyl ester carboxylesterase